MPSKQRGDELRKIIKSIRDGISKYESKEPVTTNWTQYDHAQIHEMADYLDFPESNSTTKMGFSYSVMGVGVQYILISGMSISPDHSIGETTMFPEAFGQTLDCHPNLNGVLGDGIYGCRWITDMVSGNHATPHFLPRSNVTFKSIGRRGGMICFIPFGKILRSG